MENYVINFKITVPRPRCNREKNASDLVIGRKHDRNLDIKLINIQGLSQIKASEVEDFLDEYTLFCVTETKQKCQSKKFKDNTGCIISVRDKGDKQGGGIMILYKKVHLHMEKQKVNQSDILHVSCKIFEFSFQLIVTYFDTVDYTRNLRIKTGIMGILENISDSPTLLMGDFNGHLGFIGKQDLDRTGNIVLDIAEKHNMVILNGDPLCEGEVTWSRGNQKSSIDFVLCNQIMYKRFKKMFIDEDKIKFDLSDHHLLEALFGVRCQTDPQRKEKRVNYVHEDK